MRSMQTIQDMAYRDSGGWDLVNAATAAIFVAEAIHYGVAVWSYRRG